jgi:hypothetical protein
MKNVDQPKKEWNFTFKIMQNAPQVISCLREIVVTLLLIEDTENNVMSNITLLY